MDMENIFMQMEIITRVNGKTVKNKGREPMLMRMGKLIKETGLEERSQVRELLYFLMVISTLETGKNNKCQEKEF